MESYKTDTRYARCREEINQQILQEIDLSRDVSDQEMLDFIDDLVTVRGREHGLTLVERQQLARELFYAMRRLDILQELIEDEDITEIMINGTGPIFIEKNGHMYPWEKQFSSKEKLEDVIQQIVSKCNRVVNESSPIVDARLENGSRVNIVLAPVALNGPIVTIRQFSKEPIGMEDLIGYGSLTREVAQMLERLVIAGYNIMVSGGTGSGKTTFLNALSQYIPKTERIITIEDSAELQLQNVENLVKLETRNANAEGAKEINIRDLIRTSLRMRPDRIIVGEVRGGETFDMLQVLNTGHDGSLSTGHANSARDMLSRLETMALMGMELPLSAIRRQIASGIDIIVHLGRLRDQSRRVLEIVEIIGMEKDEIVTQPLYSFRQEGELAGRIQGSLFQENELFHQEKLIAAGC